MRRKIGDDVRVPRNAIDGTADQTLVTCTVLDVHPGDPRKPARSYWVQPPRGDGDPKWVSAKRVVEAP